MSFKITYDILIEELKNDNLKFDEAQSILNEISCDLDEEQIEEAENLIYEKEQEDVLTEVSYYDTTPYDAEWRDDWWNEDNGWGEEH
tara:strand:+ start:728 stop:988 length:261 start_codon:yes stop_codon:yes gene_type:complete